MKETGTQQDMLVQMVLDATFSGIYSVEAIKDDNDQVVDFKYVFANKAVADLLLINRDELVNRSMLELIPENRSNGFFDLFCKVLVTGQTVRDEVHFVTSQMDRWFNFVIQPAGKSILVVTLQDITELKNAVIRLEQQNKLIDNILKNSSNGISVTSMIRDGGGDVVDAHTIIANDAAVAFTGLPREVYLGKTAVELDPGIIASPYGQTCLNTLATGVPSMFQYFLEITGKWLELTISKLDDDHLIHIFTDVTTVKKAEQQMAAYMDELKLSNAKLQQFTYAVSHDLKEPVRKIATFVDRLSGSLGEKLNEREKEYCQRMIIATTRMRSLIDDLLTYSSMSTAAEKTETVKLEDVMNTVLEDLEIEIEDRGGNVDVGDLPVVRGDRRQLQQLFQNILSNALKYHRQNEQPQITISSRRYGKGEAGPLRRTVGDDRVYHLIRVADNGIGFDQQHAESIFGIFTRLHNSEYYKGSGVGLALARKVAENHGGALWAEGRVDAGAVFNIVLPE